MWPSWFKKDADLWTVVDITAPPDVTAYEAAVLAIAMPTFQHKMLYDIKTARGMLWDELAPVARFVTVITS